MKFGLILSELLEEKHMSQEELAVNINFSQRAVSKWINNQAEPSATAIVKCAQFFQVTTDYLLGLEN